MRSIESDQVEAKNRLTRCSNHMDGKDCSFESSEKAIICHTNPATYGIYILLQDMLASAQKVGSWARVYNSSCPTTYLRSSRACRN
jgi:hypothetical protein